MAGYCEIAPTPRLARHVECFWTHTAHLTQPFRRVLPDGCSDLVFRFSGSRMHAVAAGAMTKFQLIGNSPGDQFLGVRFRPGMAQGILGAPLHLFTDDLVDLDALWSRRSRSLSDRLGDALSDAERITSLESFLQIPDCDSAIQRVIASIVTSGGCVSAAAIADETGISARHLRRLFLEQAGLSPKTLCRIVRFRRAVERIALQPGSAAAGTALDCGYYDQPHFINDFREFSGLTPGEYARSFGA